MHSHSLSVFLFAARWTTFWRLWSKAADCKSHPLWSCNLLSLYCRSMLVFLSPVCPCLSASICAHVCSCSVRVLVNSQVFPRVVNPGDAGWVAPPSVRVWRGHAEGHQQHGAVPAYHYAPGGTQQGLQVKRGTWMALFRKQIKRQVRLVLS